MVLNAQLRLPIYCLTLLLNVSSNLIFTCSACSVRSNRPNLMLLVEKLLAAFDVKTDPRPVVAYWRGLVFEKLGDINEALKSFAMLCDRPGFVDESFKA